MAYRDDGETRRAHIARLEDELAQLEADEAEIRALPKGARLQDRLLGGPRQLEHAFVFDGALEDLEAAAREVYEIDGRVVLEGVVSVWRAEPEPRPRRVEVRARPRDDGAYDVVITDEGSYRVYLALLGMAGMLGQMGQADVWILIYVLVALGLALGLRRIIGQQTRRRAWQARLVERRLADVAPRVRVAELEDASFRAHEEVAPPAAVAAPAREASR